jgi:aminoglycoside phosphotransferase (APT) family kinase protein
VEVSNLRAPAASGFSNETLFFDASWQDSTGPRQLSMVARLQPDGPGLYPVYDIGLQYDVMRALAEHTAVAVPTVLWREDDPSVLGAPFFVMETLDGQVPADDPPFTATGWVLDLAPTERAKLCDEGLQMLARVHAFDPQEIGLAFLARPELGGDSLDQEITFYENFYAWAAEGAHSPTVEAALTWIREHRPAELDRVALCWGDARIGNMMFDEQQSVVGVLDWEMASLGHPEQDLGWWLFMHRHHTEGFGLPHPEGFPSRAQVIARYEELTGRPVQNIEFYEAFAALRGAVIMVRMARIMIQAGLLPPESEMAENNGSSRILASMIGLPAPTGVGVTLISKNESVSI